MFNERGPKNLKEELELKDKIELQRRKTALQELEMPDEINFGSNTQLFQQAMLNYQTEKDRLENEIKDFEKRMKSELRRIAKGSDGLNLN